MKAHVAVYVKSGLAHTFTTTVANEHDLNKAYRLLHGEEVYVFANSGYRGAQKQEELSDTEVDWYIAEQPKIKALQNILESIKQRSN
jgi:IS5 family transposase